MDTLLAWQNLIFYIPLAVGLLLVFGSAFGGGDHDASHDFGHDVGHDAGGHDHSHDGSHDRENTVFQKTLSFMGVGRVPITVILMIASFLFGGIGLIMNALLAPLFAYPFIYGTASAGIAFVGTVMLTGKAAKLLNRFMPTTETYRVSNHDLVGCTGTLLYASDTSSGSAQVRDREGNVFNVSCRTSEGALPKGAPVLIYDYDADKNVFVVAVNPVHADNQSA